MIALLVILKFASTWSGVEPGGRTSGAVRW
jgi:hypothetical protein